MQSRLYHRSMNALAVAALAVTLSTCAAPQMAHASDQTITSQPPLNGDDVNLLAEQVGLCTSLSAKGVTYQEIADGLRGAGAPEALVSSTVRVCVSIDIGRKIEKDSPRV